MDLAVTVAHLPSPDETLTARAVEEFLGGKGANQATAAARLGATVTMIGAVGDDAHGDTLLAGLARNGVDHRRVVRLAGPSGLAVVTVADDGQVTIVVVPGANGEVGAALADAAAPELAAADVLLLQGEVPVEASMRAAELARAGGAAVVVNPAPVGPDSGRLVTAATVVVVNAGEARQLGLRHEEGPTQPRGTGPMRPGAELVVTLGADGALVGGHHVPAFPAPRVVDSTGAGDAFCGGLAVALAEGAPLLDAVRFGCAAGSCAVGVAGAEPSLPTRALVEAVLGR